MLIMIGLVILGVEVLRRQTAREFPDATVDDSGALTHEPAAEKAANGPRD